jgi:hypothetical protein
MYWVFFPTAAVRRVHPTPARRVFQRDQEIQSLPKDRCFLLQNCGNPTQDFRDEFDRLLIPATSVCRVIGIDAWEEDDGEHLAVVAIQYAEEGAVPKVVLVNQTTYHEHFTDMSP